MSKSGHALVFFRLFPLVSLGEAILSFSISMMDTELFDTAFLYL